VVINVSEELLPPSSYINYFVVCKYCISKASIIENSQITSAQCINITVDKILVTDIVK
jgi:hypothetical protein